MKIASLLIIAVVVAGCTERQAADMVRRLPYSIAKGICEGADNCTVYNTGQPGNGAKQPPDHWYEDAYGREERAPRH